MTKGQNLSGLEDTSALTDADWAALNKLVDIYEKQGADAFRTEWRALAKRDPQRAAQIMYAFSPTKFVNVLKDEMAASGVTAGDLEEMLRKAERSKH